MLTALHRLVIRPSDGFTVSVNVSPTEKYEGMELFACFAVHLVLERFSLVAGAHEVSCRLPVLATQHTVPHESLASQRV